MIQKLLDPEVLCVVSLNPEVRTKVARGPAQAVLQQGAFTPFLDQSDQSEYGDPSVTDLQPAGRCRLFWSCVEQLEWQAQTELNQNENKQSASDRFLEVELFQASPMTVRLSGLECEYVLALIYCHESGKREATLGFDVGTVTQDIGFRVGSTDSVYREKGNSRETRDPGFRWQNDCGATAVPRSTEAGLPTAGQTAGSRFLLSATDLSTGRRNRSLASR